MGSDETKVVALALINDGPTLADLSDTFRIGQYGLELEVRCYGRYVNLSWFARHGKHRLIAKDE
jgi:hypothetical protein